MLRAVHQRIIIFPIFLALLSSCNYEYKGYVDDLGGGWEKGRTITFRPGIEDSTANYRIDLDLRHVYGFGHRSLKLRTRIESPSGKVRIEENEIQVRKNDGVQDPEYLGSCSGDICDLRAVLIQDIRFTERGEYRIDIRHRMASETLAGVLGVGLVLKSSEPG
jgi:gliding motility-associated lipoprotein GldH